MTEPGDEIERYLAELGRALGDAVAARRRVPPWRRAAALLRRPLTGRTLAIGVAALVVSGSAMAATVRLTSEPPKPRTYDVEQYLRSGGDAYDCVELPSQALAQAVLRADPSDPNHLDEGREGVACRELPAPKDPTPVASIVRRFRCRPGDPRSALCPQRSRPFDPAAYTRPGIDQYDCSQFASQADAQAVLRFEPDDPNKLDTHGDGIACPHLPAPRDLEPVRTRAPS